MEALPSFSRRGTLSFMLVRTSVLCSVSFRPKKVIQVRLTQLSLLCQGLCEVRFL